MARFYNILIATLWLAWVTYWWVLSRRVKVNARRESADSRRSYAYSELRNVSSCCRWDSVNSRKRRVTPSASP